MLDLVVREIHDYCIEHKMKRNPKREMYINFMTNSVTSLRPICVGYKEVERVGTYKLLGVIISDDLKWNMHVEYAIAKAAKRLFALRLLKRAGAMPKDILKVYLCNVRSVLGALLNTGTEWNGTEYTGISRNIPERGRMTPE